MLGDLRDSIYLRPNLFSFLVVRIVKPIEQQHLKMKEQLSGLLKKLKEGSILFKEVVEFIETYYQHKPAAFRNGTLRNESSQNQGSAKVFAFAQLNQLDEKDTLHLFAEHYRAVLDNPGGTDHQNIRQFMMHGWPGIIFEEQALLPK